jgi:serine protease inhibitor
MLSMRPLTIGSEESEAAISPNQTQPVGMDYDRLPPNSLVPRADRTALVAGNTRFAIALYKRLLEEVDANLTVSPASISLALCMLYAGARGQTEAEMKDTLNLPLRGKELAAAAGKLLEELAVFDGNCGLQLQIANSLWGQTGFNFLLEFLETLRTIYKSELGELDFSAAPVEACDRVNTWVAEHTADRISNMLTPAAVNELTRLILVNAVYFKSAWEDKFEEDATTPAAFWVTPERSVEARLMRRTGAYAYAESPLWQALRIPYSMGYFSMTVLLPKHKGWLGEFEESLDAGFFDELDKVIAHREVKLYLPKFRIEGSFQLGPLLQSMGMRRSFAPDVADFSGITTSEPLFISNVIHKTFIEVDEQGTEAAAATAMVMVAGCAPGEPEEPVVFRADHPFTFLIRDERTGSILFMGRLANPSK